MLLCAVLTNACCESSYADARVCALSGDWESYYFLLHVMLCHGQGAILDASTQAWTTSSPRCCSCEVPAACLRQLEISLDCLLAVRGHECAYDCWHVHLRRASKVAPYGSERVLQHACSLIAATYRSPSCSKQPASLAIPPSSAWLQAKPPPAGKGTGALHGQGDTGADANAIAPVSIADECGPLSMVHKR